MASDTELQELRTVIDQAREHIGVINTTRGPAPGNASLDAVVRALDIIANRLDALEQ